MKRKPRTPQKLQIAHAVGKERFWWNAAAGPCAATLAMILAMLIIYWPVRHHAFVNYDDGLYVFENPVVKHGLTWSGVKWASTTLHISNWHPLTWMSHMIDVAIFGLNNPGPHHLVNVFFHAANTALLFGVLWRLTGAPWRSALVAALFCLHPLRVESVAWVAERKDVLSTLFGFGALWFYAGFVRNRSGAQYALVAACFALSLMAKPMLVTLPCVLLLLDYWPLRRWNKAGGDQSAKDLILEKIPFFAMAAASCWITVHAQRVGGSISPLEQIAVDQRVQNAIVAYAMYVGKFVWPVNLAVLYPHPGDWETSRIVVSAVALVAISALVAALSRKRPAMLTGWLLFLGTLVPVIGLVQVGLQAMADRYTYAPQIGLAMMIAWSVPAPTSAAARSVVLACSAIVLAALGWITSLQLRHWRDSASLFQRALAVTSGNYIAHHNLAKAHEENGDYDLAIEHYTASLAIKRDYYSAHNNLGLLLSGRDPDAGVQHLRQAAALQPDSSIIRSNLGLALAHRGLIEEAETELRRAVELDQRDAQSHLNLARFLFKQKRYAEAIDSFIASLLINSDVPEVHCELGDSLAYVGEFERAIAHFEAALKLKPDFERARFLLQKARQAQRELPTTNSHQ